MTTGRPGDPLSAESQEQHRKLRANVKAMLFGPTEQQAEVKSGTPTARSGPPPADDDDPADEHSEPNRIGRFVVIKRIGEGGMGMVYAAYDDTLDRKVAVKLLHPRSSAGSDGKARLIREAQALARLSHPSIIHVYEVDTWQEQVYLAMEFVDGGTLAEWQSQKGRTWREVLEAYVAAGRGLGAAHMAGIIHRDFKAANVLVRKNDAAVRVVDFGLARQELEAANVAARARDLPPDASPPSLSLISGESVTAADAPLTRTGVIMGTPAYMAPEQHLGRRADARSDQFSFCVSLYEALYGFRPFAGDTLAKLRRNVLAGRVEEPPRYTDIPPRIFKVLERGLKLDTADRYPGMDSLLDDLARDPRVALRRAFYVLLALLAAIAVGALWLSEREEREARAEGVRLRAQFERARVLNAEEELRRAKSRSVSEKRDDLLLAYAREVIDDDPTTALAALKHVTPGNTDWLPAARTIAVDALQRGVVHRRENPGVGRIEQMVFADEGRMLVLAGQGLVTWSIGTEKNATTITTQRLQDPGTPLQDLSVTPDGLRIAAVGLDGGLYLWERSPDGSSAADMRRLETEDGPLARVALSPDGETIATGSKVAVVRLLGWDTGKTSRVIREHKGSIRALDFAPDGETLLSAGSDRTINLWRLERQKHVTLEHGPGIRDVKFDGAGEYLWSTAEDGQVRRWTDTKSRGQPSTKLQGVTLLARSKAGQEVLACHSARELVLYREGEPQPLEGLDALVTAVAISGDGTWAAAATGDEHVQLWRLTGAGGKGTEPDGSQSMPTEGSITALAFSQAGGLLASATRQGTVELWSELGEPRGQLGRHGFAILDLGFSPQGHELAAYDENGRIIVWSVVDREQAPVVLREQGSIHTSVWDWAPNGDLVAAPQCDTASQCEVVLYPLSGEEPQVLSSVDSPPTALRFSPSGRHLLSDHHTGSWLWDLDQGRGRMLEWPGGEQPDRRLAFAYVRGGVRMATEDVVRDHEAQVVATTLRVWQIGQDTGTVHLLFEEPELRALLVDTDGRTLLLRTHDDNTLLWRLATDRFRMLPSISQRFDRMVVSPDGRSLLLRPRPERGFDLQSLWIDVESGQMRRFSRRNDPMAWSARGTIADANRNGLRIWSDPTPGEVGSFLRWLDDTTNAQTDPAAIR